MSKRIDLTKEQEEIAIKLFLNWNSVSRISELTGYNRFAISRTLKERGVLKNGNRFLLESQEKIVHDLYFNEKLGLSAIVEKTGFRLTSVRKYIQSTGKSRDLATSNRESHEYREKKTNLDFFENIDTEEKAYWLGFIFADGNVSKNGYYLRIELKGSDKSHLDKIALTFNTKASEYIRKPSKSSNITHDLPGTRITICSKQVVSSLAKVGIYPNKSHIDKLDTIQSMSYELYRHFLRGVFDGDGTIHINKTNRLVVGYCGCSTLIDFVVDHFVCELGVYKSLKWFASSIFNCTWGGKKDTEAILQYLYRDATIWLERKKEKWDQHRISKGMTPFVPRPNTPEISKLETSHLSSVFPTQPSYLSPYSNNSYSCLPSPDLSNIPLTKAA